MSDRLDALEKARRSITRARSYLRGAERWLYSDLWKPGQIDVGYWDLLTQTLDTAHAIVEELPDTFFETTPERSFLDGQPFAMNLSDDAFERAEKLLALLVERRGTARRQERIAKLANVEGRTPEEAEAFLAKAAELAGAEAQHG